MWQICLNYHQRIGILPLKKCVNRDKCSFATKQHKFGVFAIDEILRYRWTRFISSRTLCHPDNNNNNINNASKDNNNNKIKNINDMSPQFKENKSRENHSSFTKTKTVTEMVPRKTTKRPKQLLKVWTMWKHSQGNIPSLSTADATEQTLTRHWPS